MMACTLFPTTGVPDVSWYDYTNSSGQLLHTSCTEDFTCNRQQVMRTICRHFIVIPECTVVRASERHVCVMCESVEYSLLLWSQRNVTIIVQKVLSLINIFSKRIIYINLLKPSEAQEILVCYFNHN